MGRTLAIGVFALTLLSAADKKYGPLPGKMSNEDVVVTATAYIDKESIKEFLGSELPPGIVVVDVTVRPRGDKKLKLWLDDFTFRSSKDGQKAQPFAPGQIAGRGALVVTPTQSGTGVMSRSNGPVWGGIPGLGGRPSQMPGSGGGIGNATTQETTNEAKIDSEKNEEENPLLKLLTQRVLPEKEIDDKTSGLLYFSLEGKHKPKEVELVYKGSGKLVVSFQQQ